MQYKCVVFGMEYRHSYPHLQISPSCTCFYFEDCFTCKL